MSQLDLRSLFTAQAIVAVTVLYCQITDLHFFTCLFLAVLSVFFLDLPFLAGASFFWLLDRAAKARQRTNSAAILDADLDSP